MRIIENLKPRLQAFRDQDSGLLAVILVDNQVDSGIIAASRHTEGPLSKFLSRLVHRLANFRLEKIDRVVSVVFGRAVAGTFRRLDPNDPARTSRKP